MEVTRVKFTRITVDPEKMGGGALCPRFTHSGSHSGGNGS